MKALLPSSIERSCTEMDVEAALAYANNHALRALLIARGGEIALESYGEGAGPEKAQPIYSGTKSFWGFAAICAQDEGLLSLDETVAATIPAWRDDPWKRKVTLRMLLSLTAGFGFGGLGAGVPPYEKALALPLRSEPGTTFAYGGIQLQVFGAVLAAKLANARTAPQEFLRTRVLEPAGVTIGAWRSLPDGTQPLPTGVSLTARNWLAYGRYALRERERYEQCFVGTAANARYGLGWWLQLPGAPSDLFYASGAAGQALYVLPSLDTIVVHMGKSNSYKHETMIKRLLSVRPARSRG